MRCKRIGHVEFSVKIRNLEKILNFDQLLQLMITVRVTVSAKSRADSGPSGRGVTAWYQSSFLVYTTDRASIILGRVSRNSKSCGDHVGNIGDQMA